MVKPKRYGNPRRDEPDRKLLDLGARQKQHRREHQRRNLHPLAEPEQNRLYARMDNPEIDDGSAAPIGNHPGDRRRQNNQDEKPSEAINILARANRGGDDQLGDDERHQRQRIIDPVNRPERRKERENLQRRMQPMHDRSRGRYRATFSSRVVLAATRPARSGLSARVPKRRPRAVTSGGLNDERRAAIRPA